MGTISVPPTAAPGDGGGDAVVLQAGSGLGGMILDVAFYPVIQAVEQRVGWRGGILASRGGNPLGGIGVAVRHAGVPGRWCGLGIGHRTMISHTLRAHRTSVVWATPVERAAVQEPVI